MKKLILTSAASKFKIKKAKGKSGFAVCLCSFILFNFSFLIGFSQIGSWSQKASLGTSSASRSKGPGFELNGYGYVGTGYNGTAKNDFWQYDPTADTWTQKANFGGAARYGAVAFSANGFGYIGTGYTSTYANDVWKYDPAGNSWSQVANFGGSARMDVACFVLGKKVFVGTGYDGSVKNDFYEYNSVTNVWTAKANFTGTACCNATGFAVSGKGYICLGRNAASSTYYNTVYQYDSTANSWASKANFTGAAREGAASFVIGNYAYVGVGGSANLATLYNDFYKYDPVANSWSAIAGFIGSKRSHTASFSIGNYGYVGMGYTGTQVNDFYKYDLCSVTLTVTPTAPSCNGGSNGSINLTVTGATNPLTYAWSNATTLEDPSGLSSGGYSVTVTDAAGCTKSTTVTVTQPTVLNPSISSLTNASCYSLCNGKITLTTSGATPPYTYAWSPSVSSTSSATGLCAGTYSIIVTDGKGCSKTKDSVVTQPTVLTSSVSSVNATSACLCNGQTNAISGGGTAPYTYAWSPGGQTTTTATGLCGGINYSVTITDSKGCTKKDTASISPSPLTVSLTATPATCPTCPNGDATANYSGGTGPFTYAWTPTSQTTQVATGLSPGSYSVCVTDANNCTTCNSIYVGFAVGITEYYLENISVYPNPSSDGEFTVYGLQSTVTISIYDLVGKEIYSSTVNKNSSSGVHSGETINLTGMRDGIYFLKIKNQEDVITKKIILNR